MLAKPNIQLLMIAELKRAIVDKFARENNITGTSDMITVGTQAPPYIMPYGHCR